MKKQLEIGNLSVKPGEKVHGHIEISYANTSLPITIVNGEEEGPCVLITAGVHGAEYGGIETALALRQELEPEAVKGSIIIIPIANQSAFLQKVSALVPEDGKNLNRVFPGNKEGTHSEKLAYFISELYQKEASFYMDLHGGDLHEFAMPFVYYPGIGDEKIIETSKQVAQKLNLECIVRSGATSGAYNVAAIKGVPSLLFERGGMGVWNEEEVEAYKETVYRALDAVGVITLASKKEHKMPKEITKAVYENAIHSGRWHCKVKAGDTFKEGQLLGEVKDLDGNVLECYHAKMDGIALYLTVALAVSEGEPLIAYGEVKF
jgi:hypothetical protein